jgi:AcrR family transcriptional regulator
LTEIGDDRGTPSRGRILDAALAELATVRVVDDFTLEAVAARAGVSAHAVQQFWPSSPALFTAALLEWGRRHMPIPDTGTLRSDLLQYSLSYAEAVNTPLGRRLLSLVVISPRDWDVLGSREAFRAARPNRMAVMVQRAIDRGECNDGTDPALVVEVLATALSMPILFYEQPISDEFCGQIVDMMLTGILRPGAATS